MTVMALTLSIGSPHWPSVLIASTAYHLLPKRLDQRLIGVIWKPPTFWVLDQRYCLSTCSAGGTFYGLLSAASVGGACVCVCE